MVSILLLIFGHEVEYLVEIGQELLSSRNADVRLNFLRGCMVKILKMEFDQDLCKNLLLKHNSTFGSVVPLAMFKV